MSCLDVPQQMFLQGFMWKKICHYYDVCKLYNACHDRSTEVSVEKADLQALVNKINKAIEPIHMRICKGVDETNGDHCYALINTSDSELSRLATDYTTNELEFFKKIVASVISNDGKIDSVMALNLTDGLERRTSKKEADEMINKFSRDKWLVEQNGFITLSTRSLLELSPYLRSKYEDVVDTCLACREIVLQHVLCEGCNFKFHRHCSERCFTSNSLCTDCAKKTEM